MGNPNIYRAYEMLDEFYDVIEGDLEYDMATVLEDGRGLQELDWMVRAWDSFRLQGNLTWLDPLHNCLAGR